MDFMRIKNKNAIWITWERQRRNREIGKRIGVFVYEWEYIDNIKNPIVKYVHGLIKTSLLLIKVKPDIVFCQNPSIILSLFVSLIGKIFSFRVIVDTHNAGLFPLKGRYKILLKISKIIQRHAFLTIVTNRALKDYVEKNGGRAFILPDPIPKFKEMPIQMFEHPFTILFICSFADDEPYGNVFSAADIIGDQYHIYVTGNYKKKSIDPKAIPKNVTLLGYISETEYVKMIHSVDITIDLTDRENCLLCGAYESVAAEKPMVISNTEALRKYFDKGAVYTDNTARDITLSIKKAENEFVRLKGEIQQLKIEKQGKWTEKMEKLIKIVYCYKDC